MTHALKTWPEYFKAIVDGTKTFELRKADRPFNIGDRLILQEYTVADGYTGHEVHQMITCILQDAFQFGLKKGYVILGMKDPEHKEY